MCNDSTKSIPKADLRKRISHAFFLLARVVYVHAKLFFDFHCSVVFVVIVVVGRQVTNRFRMESVGHATNRGFHRPGMDVMATAKTWKVI